MLLYLMEGEGKGDRDRKEQPSSIAIALIHSCASPYSPILVQFLMRSYWQFNLNMSFVGDIHTIASPMLSLAHHYQTGSIFCRKLAPATEELWDEKDYLKLNFQLMFFHDCHLLFQWHPVSGTSQITEVLWQLVLQKWFLPSFSDLLWILKQISHFLFQLL